MADGGAFRVEVDWFQGPLPLLLRLIEREQLEITHVSVAAVVEQFVAAVQGAETPDLAAVGEFVSVAARLLLIKSRALLRPTATSVAEDAAVDYDADALARQIAEYRRFHLAGGWIEERRRAGLVALAPPPRPLETTPPRPPAILPDSLVRAAARLLVVMPATIALEDHWPDISFDEVRREVLGILRNAHARTFAQLAADAQHPLVLITRFLATLDLLRSQMAVAAQERAFGSITISLAPPDVE